MKLALREVQAVQNPALGAVLLWRFTIGYCPETATRGGAPMPLCFLVLPMTMHTATCDEITSTQAASGLRAFEQKFKSDGDYLLAIHHRMLSMRVLSLRSLRIALATGLVTLVPSDGSVWPRTRDIVTPDPSVKRLVAAAEKLGRWFGELNAYEIAGILRVEF